MEQSNASIYDNDEISPSRFPKCLSVFRHLRILTICRKNDLIAPRGYLSSYLRTLSPTLEELNLKCVDGEESLFPPSLNLHLLFPDETHLFSLLEYNSGSWSLAQCFPNLKRLKVLSQDTFFTDDDIGMFPSGLTSLMIPTSRLLTSACFEQLPKSLTKIFINVRTINEVDHVLNLPPHLNFFNSCAVISEPALRALSPDLTYLGVSTLNFTTPIIESLPRQLKKCGFTLRSFDALTSLPALPSGPNYFHFYDCHTFV
jgi:hypothetical protein